MAKNKRKKHEQQRRRDLARRARRRAVLPSFLERLANRHGLSESTGLAGEEDPELAALHEKVLDLLEQGEYRAARKAAQELLERYPDFIPALNNFGEASFWNGQMDEAIATARRVLELHPANFHGLANLVRYLFLSGHSEEIGPWVERLKASSSDDPDVWAKKAETLSILGDDRGVLEIFEAAQRSGAVKTRVRSALLHHLAAVASLRLDRPKEARELWQHALRLQPGFSPAEKNLENLERPIDQREVPWPYPMSHWIRKRQIDELSSQVAKTIKDENSEESARRVVRGYLDEHPHLVRLAPALLDRGDPESHDFVVLLARTARTPELLATLREFALGQRGSDRLRYTAALVLVRAGVLESSTVRMWIKGRWQEVQLLDFEIHEERLATHAPQVEEWAREASLALNRGDPQQAEQLLKRALQVEPHKLDLLNNLASVYMFRGRTAEGEQLIRETHRQHPDYFFGRISLAQLCVRDGDLAQAKELLEPLFPRNRYHRSEWAALCAVKIDLSLAEDNVEAARCWLDLWKRVDPEHVHLDVYRDRISSPRARRPLRR